MKRPATPTTEIRQSKAMRPICIPFETMCDIVGCGRTFGFDLLRKGEVEKVKLGRKTCVTLRSVEAMIARKTVKLALEHESDQPEALLQTDKFDERPSPASPKMARRPRKRQ